MTMPEKSKEAARKQRHRANVKSKLENEKNRQAEQKQTFVSVSCHCATPCSSTRTDFCELYVAVPLAVTSGDSKTWTRIIRLIRLKPAKEGDPLECDLFYASLDDGYHFHALSYAWGSSDDPLPIHVNGRRVNVTRNLHTALFHLRNDRATTVVWVDAICIDQGNLPERTDQVKHMPQIYRAAAEVIAWLGKEADGSGLVMEYIKSYAIGTSEVLSRRSEPTFSQLESLWARPYWSRIWVVQELASGYRSSGKCFIKCGHQSVPFDQFRHFLGDFLDNYFYTGYDSVLGPKFLLNLSIIPEETSFLEILSKSGALESTDKRDRVYGIRGISPEFYRTKIPVDYEIDFQELCRTVVSTYIKKEKTLDILCQFGTLPPQYPSWVRDLSNVNHGVSLSAHSASVGGQSNPTISDSILHVKGKRIGVVELVRGPYKFPPLESLKIGQPWPTMPRLKRLENFVLAAMGKRHRGSPSGNLHERFMNMVSGDRWRGTGMHGLRVSLDPYETWESVSRYKEASPVDEQMMLEYKYFTFLFSPLIGRTLFATAGGNVGVGPPNMQKDDMICLLYGCSYCVVLRKVKQRHYAFIGPAYVDNAMSGEYVRQEYDDEGAQMREEQFHIH
ncbi:hypothetical protein TruAng_011710 [Truncatella angustata]|nr:hypothetical protein TruAng_011710 [Truncatella angustata]